MISECAYTSSKCSKAEFKTLESYEIQIMYIRKFHKFQRENLLLILYDSPPILQCCEIYDNTVLGSL